MIFCLCQVPRNSFQTPNLVEQMMAQPQEKDLCRSLFPSSNKLEKLPGK